MSSLHCSPYWSHDQKLLSPSFQTIEQGVVPGWKVVKPTSPSQKITLFGTMIGELLERVAITAKQNIPMHSQDKVGTFCINPTKDCQQDILGFQHDPHYKNTAQIVDEVAAALLKYISARRGTGKIVVLDLEDQTLLNSNHFMFSYQAKNREIENWKAKMIVDSLMYIYDEVGFKKIESSIFQTEDLHFLEIEEKDLASFKQEKLSCFNYALLKKQETKAKTMILKHGEDPHLLQTLQHWGYRPVRHPNEGDLVIYFSTSESRPQHMGLYSDEGLVESKLGINNETIYRHRVFALPQHYASSIIFMRKSQATF